jgi:hypothetical protein
MLDQRSNTIHCLNRTNVKLRRHLFLTHLAGCQLFLTRLLLYFVWKLSILWLDASLLPQTRALEEDINTE